MDNDKWREAMVREGSRDLTQKEIDSVLDTLEEIGLVKRQKGYVDPTDAFRTLFTRAVNSLIKRYEPRPGDNPQSLIGLEMARLALQATPTKIERGTVDPVQLGRVSNVITGLLRHFFTEHSSKDLMELLR